MRYITVPGKVSILNPLNDEPMIVTEADGSKRTDTFTFQRSCRTAIFCAMEKTATDSIKLIDIRKKTDAAVPGKVLELNDDEWQVLEPEFRRPNVRAFGAGWIFSAEDHIRAVLDAPTKMPVVAVSNGVADHAAPAEVPAAD